MIAKRPKSTVTGRAPRVSIAMPVYNGETYLAAAIESILAQTYTDFELILCDNASTDQTARICRHYAARDPRVRYHRNDHNLGAAPNFNKGYELSRGEYLKWAAYDDLLEPGYLQACVEALDADPRTVLAHTRTRVIDHLGRRIPIGPHPHDSVWWEGQLLRREDLYDPERSLTSHDLDERLTTFLLNTGWCFEIFGLMRVSALKRSPLHLSFYGSDKVLLAALVIQGTFVEVPAELFLRRYHQRQSCNQDNASAAVWMDSSAGGTRLRMPGQMHTMIGLLRVVNDAGLSLGDRLRGYRAVGRWLIWLLNLIWRLRHRRGLLWRVRRGLYRAVGRTLPEQMDCRPVAPTMEHAPGDLATHQRQAPALERSVWSRKHEQVIDVNPAGRSGDASVRFGGGAAPSAVSILPNSPAAHVR